MKTKLIVSLVAVAIGCLGASTGWAQGAAHVMVTPDDLKWQDVPSLPAGAKMAVLEGPPTQAVPFTFRLKFPADYKIPAHSHPAIRTSSPVILAICARATRRTTRERCGDGSSGRSSMPG